MNYVKISLKKDKILVTLKPEAKMNDILDELKEKMPGLKTLYKDSDMPILVTGKHLENSEIDEVSKIISTKIKTEVKFDSPKEMGIHAIIKTFEEDLSISETKYIKGAIRSGNKINFEKSIVIIGDVNAGAEVIAGGNIVVTGALRGMAHAGAKGNKSAIIAAKQLESPQIRISNIVMELEKETEVQETKQVYAFIKDDKIVVEKM